jgi:hypothetical protein
MIVAVAENQKPTPKSSSEALDAILEFKTPSKLELREELQTSGLTLILLRPV